MKKSQTTWPKLSKSDESPKDVRGIIIQINLSVEKYWIMMKCQPVQCAVLDTNGKAPGISPPNVSRNIQPFGR